MSGNAILDGDADDAGDVSNSEYGSDAMCWREGNSPRYHAHDGRPMLHELQRNQ